MAHELKVNSKTSSAADLDVCAGLATARAYSDFDAVEKRMASGVDSLATARQGMATARRAYLRETSSGGGMEASRNSPRGWAGAYGGEARNRFEGTSRSSSDISSDSASASDDDEYFTADFGSAPMDSHGSRGDPQGPRSDENSELEQRLNSLLAKSGAFRTRVPRLIPFKSSSSDCAIHDNAWLIYLHFLAMCLLCRLSPWR